MTIFENKYNRAGGAFQMERWGGLLPNNFWGLPLLSFIGYPLTPNYYQESIPWWKIFYIFTPPSPCLFCHNRHFILPIYGGHQNIPLKEAMKGQTGWKSKQINELFDIFLLGV